MEGCCFAVACLSGILFVLASATTLPCAYRNPSLFVKCIGGKNEPFLVRTGVMLLCVEERRIALESTDGMDLFIVGEDFEFLVSLVVVPSCTVLSAIGLWAVCD